jgi:hypothetical protein
MDNSLKRCDPMPITYHIYHDQRLVVVTPDGVLSDADVFNYQKEVWSRPETKGYNEFIDMTGVSQIDFVSADRVNYLAEISGRMDSPESPSKLAILATSEVSYGLGRMYEAYRNMTKPGTKVVRVFRTRQEALQWLDVSI